MITFRKQILIGVTAIGLGLGSLAAHANPGEHPEGRPAPHKMERMKERMEKRAEALRAKLNLTADQQKAWEKYMAAMQPAAPAARPERLSRDEMAKLTAPERMERMHRMMQHAEQQMARHVAATRDFYAVLTPEQRKVFDENFRMGPGHPGKRR